MERIIRTITQKCPCGYVFKERQTTEKQLIRREKTFSFVGTDPGYKIVKENKTTSEIIDGNQKFIEASLLSSIDTISQDCSYSKFIICPKCGTLLCKEIATTITEEKS